MTYETMDWEAEAKRLEAAFKIKGEFRERIAGDPHSKMFFKIGDAGTKIDCFFQVKDQICLGFYYHVNHRIFAVRNQAQIETKRTTYMTLNWDDTNCYANLSKCNLEGHLILARGLFHLNLLTPKVEAELQVTISAHQKLEWQLEYEARLTA